MSGRALILSLVGASLALAIGLGIVTRDRVIDPLTADVELLGSEGIRFPAIVNAGGFHNGDMPGYHAIVWRGGRASDDALFQAQVTDVQVLDALESLGFSPSNDLTMDSWDERHDESHPAPDRLLEGPRVSVHVEIDSDAEPLASFLLDEMERPLDIRFGGHRALIPEWRSGCVLCLYSCPGSKVGNRSYSVRDYVDQTTQFRANLDRLPDDGTQVWIQIKIES